MLLFIQNLLLIIMSFIIPNKKLEPKSVYNYCLSQEIEHPDIVTAQAIVETGWFKCENCTLSKNNIFGFYNGENYLSFSSWKESIDYYKTWQSKRYKPGKNYYEFLRCVSKKDNGDCTQYAQNMSKYITLLKSIVKDHSNEWKN